MRVKPSIRSIIRWIAAVALMLGWGLQRDALAVLVDLEGLGVNADFEDPDADPANDGAEQTVARNLGPGWTYNLLGGHSSDFGLQDPADGYYVNPLVAPFQGRQIGYFNLEAFSAGEIVSRSIGTITAGQNYTLNVGVGARNNLTWSDLRYAIGLRAGSTDLGTFATVTLDPGATPTNTSDLVYTLNVNAEAAGFIGSDAKIVIRGINLGTTGSGTTPAFTQANFDNVRLDGTFGAPNWPLITIDRTTGNISLSKTGTTNTSVTGYTLTSAASSFNYSNWLSIADHYDKASAPTPGNGSVDGDDAWTILSPANSKTNLAEGEVEFGGNGGTLSNAAPINLGNSWRKSPFQDVQATVSLADGSVLTANVAYTGTATAFQLGDLNVDGLINGLDWTAFKNAQGTNFTGLTTVEAYLAGDLDNDKDRDLNDFVLFRTAYDTANGPGMFDVLLTGVPEPTTLLLLITGSFFMLTNTRRQNRVFKLSQSSRHVMGAIVVLAVSVLVATSASAQTIVHWTFDSASRTDNGTNITGFADTTGNHNATNTVAAGGTGGTQFTSNPIPIGNNITGRFGQGLTLTGFNTAAGGGGQFLTYPSLYDLMSVNSAGPNPSYTVSYWLNTTTPNAQSLNLFSDWGTAASNPGRFTYGFGFDFTGTTARMRGQARNNTTGAGNGADIFARTVNQAAINNGSWHMLTWTYDTTVGQLKSYFDATLIDTFNSTVTNFNMIRSSSANGAWGLKGDTGNFLNGTISIDEGWVLQGALTQTEVTTLFNNNTPPVPPAILKLRVDLSTGQAQLRNTSGQDIALNAYRITSSGTGSLNPSGWTPIAGQSISGFPSGNGSGNGWETPPSVTNPADYSGNGFVDAADYATWRKQDINGQPGYTAWREAYGNVNTPPGSNKELVEWYLQGDSTFTNGMQPINLGQLFKVGMTPDLSFSYTVGQNVVVGTVEYGSLSGPSLAEVPEPSTVWMILAAVCAGSIYTSRGRRYVVATVSTGTRKTARVSHLFFMLVAIAAMDSVGSSASAAYTLDRLYHFGDDALEDGANATANDPDGAGPIGGDVGSGPANISPNNTFDSQGTLGQGEIIVMAANGATGKPKYIDVSVTSPNLAQVRPGAPSGNRGVLFDGVDDYLNGLRFNNPNTAPGTVQYTPPGPNNYNGVFTRGFQLWVYPATATANEWIVRDTQQHGLGINNQQEWQLSYNNNTVDSNVAVVFNQWHHVMVAMPGSLPNREVLYVNGIAIAARQSNYTTSDAANTFSLVVGADTGDTAPTVGDSDRFKGVVDELEMFAWGSTYDANTNTATNLGQFNYATDNAYAASHLTGVAGDVNQSGTFTQQDIDDFVTFWMSQRLVNGVQVGDVTTILKGDLNFDGITNLQDLTILRAAIPPSGAGNFNLTALNNLGVPEPATILMGIWLFAAFSIVRRRRTLKRSFSV